MSKPSRILYHYCSVENFLKIIQSRSLWLSNCSQMNDSKEITWVETYFEFVNDFFPRRKYHHFLKYLFTTYDWNKKIPYIFCLSEIKDSLSQWRAYATDGKGVCIGFNIENIGIKKTLPGWNINRDKTIGICKIEYNELKQKRLIQKTTEHFKKIYDKKEDEIWQVASTFLALELVNYSLTFKNPSFAEEKEWRILHTPINKSRYKNNKNKIDISDVMFRAINNKITTYTVLNLEKRFNSVLIPEIVLGPKSEVDIQILESFLESNNLKQTKIIKSKSSYR